MRLSLISICLLCSSILISSVVKAEVFVVDGDTIKLDGTTYRLEGIDAPEHGQSCVDQGKKKWPCGKLATLHLKNLIGDKVVRCVGSQKDNFGRMISTCYSGDTNLNRSMILDGFAWAFVKFSQTYVTEEKTARAAKIGVWRAPTQTPWDFRSERWTVALQEAPRGCPIKGNISSNGMIYHAPWSPWYSRTKISVEKGERWFCDEAEAIDAGWRAPLWGR